MAPDSNDKRAHRIPIRFMDPEKENAEADSGMDTENLDDSKSPDETLELTADFGEQEEPAVPEAAGGPLTAELVATRAELKRVQEENAELKDRLARRQADFENYRKRVERERREQADRAVVGILEDLIGVVDDFDLALAGDAGESGSAYRRGVELIHAKLQDLLRKHGVKPIDAFGADFDPNLHEAVMQESSPGHRDNEVIAVLRKGYTINDRLLRPAAVKVAKA